MSASPEETTTETFWRLVKSNSDPAVGLRLVWRYFDSQSLPEELTLAEATDLYILGDPLGRDRPPSLQFQDWLTEIDATQEEGLNFLASYIDQRDCCDGFTVDEFFTKLLSAAPALEPTEDAVAAPSSVMVAEPNPDQTGTATDPYVVELSMFDTERILGWIDGSLALPTAPECQGPDGSLILFEIQYPLREMLLHVILVRGDEGLYVDAYITDRANEMAVAEQVGAPDSNFFRTFLFDIDGGIALDIRPS
jgi:hypothetical protein